MLLLAATPVHRHAATARLPSRFHAYCPPCRLPLFLMLIPLLPPSSPRYAGFSLLPTYAASAFADDIFFAFDAAF